MKDNKKADFKILMRLAPYFKNNIPGFILNFVLVILMVVFELSVTYVIKMVVDSLEYGTTVKTIILFALIILTLYITSGVIRKISRIILQKVGQDIVYNIRRDLFERISTLDIEYFNNNPVGKLVSRMISDTENLNEVFTSVFENIIYRIGILIGSYIMIFVLDYKIGIYVFSLYIVAIITTLIFKKYYRKIYSSIREKVSIFNVFLSEHLSGMKVIQILQKESQKKSEFKEKSNNLYYLYKKEIVMYGFFRPLMYFYYFIALILLLYFGGKQVISGTISIGIIVGISGYLERSYEPLISLAESFNVIQSAIASTERIVDILDLRPKIDNKNNPIVLNKKDFTGEIEFKNVWFSYSDDENWILRDVSFKLNSGKTIAIIGATGAGKTTIISLIARYYDIQKGNILVDGIDIKDIEINSLRKAIGQMLQDVFIFSGTIKDNITLNNEKIKDDKVLEVVDYVGAKEFIEKYEDGINHVVKEKGKNFSTGQKQLISLARTLSHEPIFLILDEATANIDTNTEEKIQNTLLKLMNEKTMIVIAHRLSTIKNADEILVMERGKIIEQGTHNELINNSGTYKKLYDLQYDNKNE